MTTVYLLSEKTTAKKEHGRMCLESADGKRRGVPMGDVDCVVVGRRAHITMPLVFALLEQGTPLSFVNGKGELVASMGGDAMSAERFRGQCEKFDDDFICLNLAVDILCEKIRRQHRLIKSYAKRKKSDALEEIAKDLASFRDCAWEMEDVNPLRGCEGMAARRYFQAFTEILDQNLWPWEKRSRRPAHDPVNALLNLAYAFLEREVRIAIVGARLDPRIGFLHANNGRKDSLVYDLMELFRATVADRFVLRMLNYGALSPEDFTHDEEQGCRLTEKAFPVWCAAHEDYMTKPVKDYEGNSPREKIRKEVREFAEHLFKQPIPSFPEEGREEGEGSS